MSDAVIKQLSVGPMMNFSYIIGDAETKTCAVVDPGFDAGEILKSVKELGFTVKLILLTHSHFDHAGALKALSTATGAKLAVHKDEVSEMPSGMELIATEEGTELSLGKTKIKCIHTPGHSPGSQCFIVDGSIFTGDTLFVEGCGRVDLPGGNPRAMLASLKRLSELDPGLIVYPGHDYGPSPTSTIGEQKKRNPYLHANTEEMII